MKGTRTFRLVLAITLLLNVAGSPMAWAHWLGAPHAHAAAAAGAPSCHGPESPAPDHSAPGTLPCCDGAGCACAAAPLLVTAAAPPTRVPHPLLGDPADTSVWPAHPLDDTLRPPIR